MHRAWPQVVSTPPHCPLLGQGPWDALLQATKDDNVISLQKRISLGTSLVVQWLRIRLPMQGTRVQSLVQEDPNPTCRGATKSIHHNY